MEFRRNKSLGSADISKSQQIRYCFPSKSNFTSHYRHNNSTVYGHIVFFGRENAIEQIKKGGKEGRRMDMGEFRIDPLNCFHNLLYDIIYTKCWNL